MITQDRDDNIFRQRIADLEKQIRETQDAIQRIKDDWTAARADVPFPTDREPAADEAARLREAVLRYAIACAAVDLQVAILRARGETHGESIQNLQRCTDEQTEASNALRLLAREIQS